MHPFSLSSNPRDMTIYDWNPSWSLIEASVSSIKPIARFPKLSKLAKISITQSRSILRLHPCLLELVKSTVHTDQNGEVAFALKTLELNKIYLSAKWLMSLMPGDQCLEVHRGVQDHILNRV